MNKRWQVKKRGRGTFRVGGLPTGLVAVGLIIALLYSTSEKFRMSPLASWSPLLILLLLIPGVVFSVYEEIKRGKESGLFIKQGPHLRFEGAFFKSHIVQVVRLSRQDRDFLLVFVDEQGKSREVLIDAKTENLSELIDELEKRR